MYSGSRLREEVVMAKNKISRFGPGFLVTAAFIGPGTVTTCTRAGSEFGYALIFALLFATKDTKERIEASRSCFIAAETYKQ